MSQQQFRLTSSYTKSFGMMAGIGVLLFVGGLLLSNVTWPAQKHAAEHAAHVKHGAAKGGHGDQHHGNAGHEDHATVVDSSASSDSLAGDSAHQAPVSNGGEQHGKGDQHGNSHIYHFASDPNEAAKAEGGHAEEGHHEEGHEHHSDHQENGIWRRAYFHPGQEVMGHHAKGETTTSAKIGASLFIGSFWWTAVALFGVFFIAVGYVANAGWYVAFKRVLENYYRFLPIGAGLLLITFFVFGKDVWEWYALEENVDTLIDSKRWFLNIGFILATGVLFFGLIYPFVGHMYKKNSLQEDSVGGVALHKKNILMSAIFLPLFAIGFAMTAFLWIMSVDPHWFSTIFAVYVFAGMFVSGMTITMFITTHLKEKGFLTHFQGDHLHDIGKFMFAFSVFWAYIWVSQYLLIWYANIPEETIYYWTRVQDYPVLFALNVVINFVYPFIALMTRKAKREHQSIRGVGRVILFGRFLDLYLMVAPAVLGAAGGFETMMMAAGALLIVGSIFLFVVFKGFEDGAMEAKNHPFFEESVHHSTGV